MYAQKPILQNPLNMTIGLSFNILCRDDSTGARRGRIETPHGEADTPLFMPVGTRATVKGLTPQQLRDCGSRVLLANTYHLLLRPGVEVVESLGGLHRFMGWDGPLLTDSGGFQVFSLADLREITDEGACFSSHIDGERIFLTPQRAIEVQNRLGADMIMVFDHCPSWPAEPAELALVVERTLRWAELSLQATRRTDQWLFGIVQGGTNLDLRRRCLEKLISLDFPGYALGGLSVGEPRDLREAIVSELAPQMPPDRPRYLMGVGMPLDIIEAVAAGVDMFDCVLPTRNGRNGYAFTSNGGLKIRNEKYKTDTGPLDGQCSCYTCSNFARGYLRHLFLSGEMLGPMLLSLHNIAFFQRFMQDIRSAIEQGRFGDLLDRVRSAWPAGRNAEDRNGNPTCGK